MNEASRGPGAQACDCKRSGNKAKRGVEFGNSASWVRKCLDGKGVSQHYVPMLLLLITYKK